MRKALMGLIPAARGVLCQCAGHWCEVISER